MSSHRVLNDLFKAFDSVGPGRITDPGASGTITVTMWGEICPVVTATAEARTLTGPTKPGVLCAVCLDTDDGDLTLTVGPDTGSLTHYGYNRDLDTDITFQDAGDYVVFYSIKIGTEYVWRILAQEGTDAATEEGTFDTLTVSGTGTITDLEATQAAIDGQAQVGSLAITTVTAVAAAGSTQGTGGALVEGINIVSAADNTKCVDVPAASGAGVIHVISATAAKTLPMFPASGEAIDGAGANNAVTVAAATGYSTCILVSDGTQWYTILGDSV